ncbi:MAG: hypothetical protein O3C27_14605 [Actinomycetota bacterium]|nr:hypothetical protein [Actinomycetota bacterium]
MTPANDAANQPAPDPTLPAPQFRKTKTGKWAVVAPVPTLEAALAADGKVAVLKKSGDWGTFSVSSIGRPFDVDGVAMCYGYGPDDESEAATARPAAGRAPSPTPARPSGPSRSAAPSGPRRQQSAATPPPPDATEPLPEYRGGPEDEWQESY